MSAYRQQAHLDTPVAVVWYRSNRSGDALRQVCGGRIA
jgi:hypothetical protein